MQIRNDDVTLNLTEDGDPAAPPLLLLHGITSFGGTWEWIVPELAERFRVLRLDFRGHGASDRAPDAYSSPGYVSDAIAVCEQVIGRPCIVMGHSLGGVTAAIVMQQRPDLIRAAILEDPPLGIPEGIVDTLWFEVEERCREFGDEFDAWQDGLGQVMLGLREDGMFAATVGGIAMSIPRQVAKTFIVGRTVVALCSLYPDLTVLWTAHRLRTATMTFDKLKAFVTRSAVRPYLEPGRSVVAFQDFGHDEATWLTLFLWKREKSALPLRSVWFLN